MSIRFYNFWSNDAAINKFFYYTHCGDAILAVNDKSTRQNDLRRVLFSWKLQEKNQGEQESREGYGFLTGIKGGTKFLIKIFRVFRVFRGSLASLSRI